jgi:predicted CXXCH cytochrome family protein
MKYIKIVLLIACVLGISEITKGQSIKGSKHDFSNATNAAWNTAANLGSVSGTKTTAGNTNIAGQVCAPCHAPHNALLDGNNNPITPLWQHKLSSVTTYTPYSGYSMKATFNQANGQPDGNSKLCLSCHDGTVALQNYVSAMGGTGSPSSPTYMNATTDGAMYFGTNLSNDHPVSFIYNSALVTLDPGLRAITSPSGITSSGTIATDMLDGNSEVQCTSCHDPHNSSNGNFLIKSNSGSNLCVTCHAK